MVNFKKVVLLDVVLDVAVARKIVGLAHINH